MNRQRGAVSALILAFAVLATPASAQQPTEAQIDAIKKNCRSDFMSKCRGVKTGGTEAVQCLKSNKASLSGGCAAAISAISPPPASPAPAATAKPAPAPVAPPPTAAAPAAPPPAAVARPAEPKPAETPAAPAPAKPAAAAAPAAPPAPAKPAAAKPAPAPQPAVAAAPSAPAPVAATPAAPPRALTLKDVALVRRTCMADIGLHCKGIKPGDRRVVECLEAKGDALLPVCKQAVAKTRQ